MHINMETKRTGADTGFQSGGPDFLETQKSLHMGKFFEVF